MAASTLCWGGFDESEWLSGRFGEEKSRMEPRSHGSPARSCRCDVVSVFKVMDAVVFREDEGSWVVATDRLTTPQPCGMRDCVIPLPDSPLPKLRGLSALSSLFALQLVYNRIMLDRPISIPSSWTEYKRTGRVYDKWGSVSFFVSKAEKNLGSLSSPLCVWKLEMVCSQTQLYHLKCI